MKKFGFLIGMVFFYCVSVLAQGPTPKTSAPKTFDGGVEFTVATTQTTCGSSTGTATINVVAGTPTTYVWYDELDNEIATGVSLVENLASGNYYVVVVNAANCSSQQIFSIDASDVNPTTIALTSVDDNVCFGSEVVITATSVDATAYQWYNDGVLIDGQTSEILTTTDLPVGTNSITARSQQGTCWSPLSDPIEIVVNGYPTFTISDDMPETICGDEIVTYTITVTGGTPNYTVSLVESSHPYIMVSPYDQTNVTVTVDGGQAIFSVRLQNPPNAGEQVIGFTTSYIVVDQNGCYEP